MEKFYIYKLTFKSGATYVGQHTQKKENDGYITSSGYYRHHKNDDPLVKREILIEAKDRDSLDLLETICICDDKASNDKNVNYNIGQYDATFYRGGWNKGKKASAETRKKISEGLKGRKPWNYGKKLSEEHKRKISENSAHYNGMLGKKISDEIRKKMSESHKGKPHSPEWNKKVGDAERGVPKSKESIAKCRKSSLKYFTQVKCVEDNLEFDSMATCSRYYGIVISNCIKKFNGYSKKINKHFIVINEAIIV